MSGPSNVKKREPGRRSDLLGPSNMKARELFLSIGLDDRTATNALANAKVTSNLTDVIHEHSAQFVASSLHWRHFVHTIGIDRLL
ncbi:hypothetical protein GOP47_0031150 [Adiantum capillus-veneris]|nr:hypothetical protein GOP47_0031150 [Adiantum capillus-veneris]